MKGGVSMPTLKKILLIILMVLTFVPNANVQAEVSNQQTMIIQVESQQTISAVKKAFPNLQIRNIYDTLFYGLSVKGEQKEINRLLTFKGVKKMYPNKSYHVSIDESAPFIGATAFRHAFLNGEQKLTGKGIKVGVIDTGIDYTHPDLQKNYHGGYDVVDQDNDPMETTKAQGEPTMHGTHVAGIIAANGEITGVAPDAELYGYRALGPGGVGTSEFVIAAIEKAVEDGMDVINLSLGNAVNGPDWPTSIALNRAVEKGVIAVTANGNAGPYLWTVGSPGTAEKAISVGASSPPMNIPFITTQAINQKIPVQPLQGSASWGEQMALHDFELVDGGLGYEKDLPTDLHNKIVLIKRGEIHFTEKVINAQQKGAKAVLIYNHEKGMFHGALEKKVDIPVSSLSYKTGMLLQQKLKQKRQWVQTTFTQVKDQLASFSSRGPVTHTWSIKPDVIAPGMDINSTVPNGYRALNGTSMASPHVTGAVALLKQAHPDWSPAQMKAALMNTAKLLEQSSGLTYSPFEQGAGRIQVKKANNTTSLIYPASITFGKMTHQNLRKKKSIKVTIENVSDTEQTYSFKQPKYQHGVQWQLPTRFTLSPKEKHEVKIAIDLQPKVIKPGMYSGILSLTGGSHSFHMPYLFVIEEPDYPRIMGFSFKQDQQEPSVYTYEFYLPEGAKEVGVALYDPNSYLFKGMLFYKNKVKRGLITGKIRKSSIPLKDGVYKAIIYAEQSGQLDYIESIIELGGHPPNQVNNKSIGKIVSKQNSEY